MYLNPGRSGSKHSFDRSHIEDHNLLKLPDALPDLDELIARLRDKRQELAQEYRKKTAVLLAKILVKDELEIIRGQEDLKI